MNKKNKPRKLTEQLKLQIRNEFVQGNQDFEGNRAYPTLEELTEKFSVAKSTLYRVSQKEQWKIEKQKFQQELTDKLDKERVKNLAEESKRFDNTSINLAMALLGTVAQAIRKNSTEITRGRRGLIPSQLNALANTAMNAQKIAKLALGETTENVNLNATLQRDTYAEAMELLDELENIKRTSSDSATH